MIFVDTLAYSSPLRQKSPAVKAALAVGMLLICVSARSIVLSACVLLVMAALTIGAGKIPARTFGGFLLLPLGFLLLGTLAVVCYTATEPGGLFSVPVGSIYLVVDSASLWYGARLASVALASVSCLYFLSLTTPMTDLIVLLRTLHCPSLLLELMFLMYRFLFVLLDLTFAIRTAQHCRLGNRDKKTALKSTGALLAVLLERSFARSSQLYDAMESRCYDGEIRVLNRLPPAQRRDVLFTAILLGTFFLFALFIRFCGRLL